MGGREVVGGGGERKRKGGRAGEGGSRVRVYVPHKRCEFYTRDWERPAD